MPFGATKGKFDLPYDENRAKQFMSIYEKLVEESWTNSDLKQRLKTDLTGLLEENGFDTEGRKFETYETELDQKHVVHLPLPKKPSSANLNEEQLAAIAGGSSCAASGGTAASASCPVGSASSAGSAGSGC